MNRAEQAGLELREMDELAAQDSVLHRLSPLSKLFVTVFYIAVTVSFPKYGLTRLVWMALFPVAGYQLAGLPMRLCFCGEFPSAAHGRGSAASWPYALLCPVLMLLARYFDLSALLGGLFV